MRTADCCLYHTAATTASDARKSSKNRTASSRPVTSSAVGMLRATRMFSRYAWDEPTSCTVAV